MRSIAQIGLFFAASLFFLTVFISPACKDKKNTQEATTASADTTQASGSQEQVIQGIEPAPGGPDSRTVRMLFLSRRALETYGKTLTNHGPIKTDPSIPDEQKIFPVVDTLLKAGKYKYYVTATNLLHQIQPTSPLETEALKLLAFCRYNLGDRENAIAYYEKYAAKEGTSAQENDWAMCLYYMADFTKHEQQFRERLQKILDTPGHAYAKQARELEAELKNFTSGE